jgi:hypothetical protein
LQDLPSEEQDEIRAFIGQTAVVDEIDQQGNFWLEFGTTVESDDAAHYSGHTFGVPRAFIEQAK